MDDKIKELTEKIGGHWAVGLGSALLGGLGLLTGWIGGRKEENPAIAHLKSLQDTIKRHDAGNDVAKWASMRSGDWLRQALLSNRDEDRHAFTQAAVVMALYGHAAHSAAKKALLQFADDERLLFSKMGVEIPDWDRTLDFVRERHNDIIEVPELRERLVEVSREIEAKLRARDKAPADYEKSIWRVAPLYGDGVLFSDLSESERAEVMKEHDDWTAASIMTARWKKHEPEPAPPPPVEPDPNKPF